MGQTQVSNDLGSNRRDSKHPVRELDDECDRANAAMFKSGWLRLAGARYHSSCYGCSCVITVYDSKLMKIDRSIGWIDHNTGLCCKWCARRAFRQGLGALRSKLLNGSLSQPIRSERNSMSTTHREKGARTQTGVCAPSSSSGRAQDTHTERKKFTRLQRQAVWEMEFGQVYSGACRCCGTKMIVFEWHIAHKVSLAQGGHNGFDNLTATCSTCNLSMGTTSLDDFRRLSGYSRDGIDKLCIIL
jgi:5-methylcytosine-specific restriction endonuclease McrA